MIKLSKITSALEKWAPLPLQESYDNSGLLVGDPSSGIDNVLVTLDVTEDIVREAIDSDCQLILAHHPLIFGGIKKIDTGHWIGRCLTLAIKHDIAIYAIHTNLDNIQTGVNARIAQRIGLQHVRILRPKKDTLRKLTTFVPASDRQKVLDALWEAGAGNVGNYDHCSFQVEGTGSFRPGEETSPHIGSKGTDESVNETRIEVLIRTHESGKIIAALKESHPYEEVTYYLTDLSNSDQETGAGMIGTLNEPLPTDEFLRHLKQSMSVQFIRHTKPVAEKIKKVAICGGSGSFLLRDAIGQNADAFVTGDFKYHDFFEANDRLIIADIGHYESEQFTRDLLHDFLTENFANIAVRLSEVSTNPIIYY